MFGLGSKRAADILADPSGLPDLLERLAKEMEAQAVALAREKSRNWFLAVRLEKTEARITELQQAKKESDRRADSLEDDESRSFGWYMESEKALLATLREAKKVRAKHGIPLDEMPVLKANEYRVVKNDDLDESCERTDKDAAEKEFRKTKYEIDQLLDDDSDLSLDDFPDADDFGGLSIDDIANEDLGELAKDQLPPPVPKD